MELGAAVREITVVPAVEPTPFRVKELPAGQPVPLMPIRIPEKVPVKT